VLTIDCSTCVLADTSACADCLVNFIVGRQPGEAVRIAPEEERAVRLLGRAGLVGEVRHISRRAAGTHR
jgi:hypothetical protein